MTRGRYHLVVHLATVLLILTFSCIDSKAKKTPKNGDKPLEGRDKLVELQSRVRNGVVPFTDEILARYVIRPDRPYHLVLLLTAMTNQFNCDICKVAAPEYELLGKSYEAAKQIKVATSDGLEVFFGVLDYDTNKEGFSVFDQTSAPHIMYVAPDKSTDVGGKIPKKVKVEPQNIYNVFTHGVEAEAMATFVKQHTGFNFAIQRSKTLMYLFVVMVCVAAAVMATLVLKYSDFVLAKLRRKQLWMTVSLLFYGLSVSGMVYCIIRNPPPFSVDNKGNVQYFHPAGRQQFVYEGLIVGGFDVGAAVLMVLLSQWAVYVRHPAVRSLAVVGCALGFVFMYRQMTGAYKYKNQWYTGFMGI